MKYPNAYIGVRRLFISRILALIGEVALFIGGVALFIGIGFALALSAVPENATDSELAADGALTLTSLVFILISSVLLIISFILGIVGLSRASNDEPSFRIALFAMVMNIIVVGFGSMFKSMNYEFTASLMNTASTVLDLFAFVFTIQGIRKLAVQVGDNDMDDKGNTLFKLLIVVFALELISNLIVAIFGGQTASVIAGIIALAGAVFTIIEYILFLVYLSKAKKMLANAAAI